MRLRTPCAKRASKRPSARPWWSICATPRWRGSNCSTTNSIAPFEDVPKDVELFDRGVSKGDVPRLWVDVIAHVEMGRDKRQYRFVQDTRYGRAVLAESYEIPQMVQAVTRYVARRLVERERALADDTPYGQATSLKMIEHEQRRGRLRAVRAFCYGVIVAVIALVAIALLSAPHPLAKST